MAIFANWGKFLLETFCKLFLRDPSVVFQLVELAQFRRESVYNGLGIYDTTSDNRIALYFTIYNTTSDNRIALYFRVRYLQLNLKRDFRYAVLSWHICKVKHSDCHKQSVHALKKYSAGEIQPYFFQTVPKPILFSLEW